MRRLLIFTGRKGGAGKSFTARAYLDLARAAGRSVSAWDLDDQAGSLALLYGVGEATAAVAAEDVRDPRAPGAWLDAVHGPADDVLLDVPGGHLSSLVRVIDTGARALVAEAKRAKRELVIVSVIGTKRDSTATPQEAIQVFGTTDVRHVVVLNGFYGDEDGFLIFRGFNADVVSGDKKTTERRFGKTADAVKEAKGDVLFLPRLSANADELLDIHSLTFTAGAQAVDTIGRRAATNVRYWLDDVRQRFANTALDVAPAPKAARGNAVA